MICYIDFNGNTQFVKTMEDLQRAYNNGYVREAFKCVGFRKWEKIQFN